MSTFKLGLEAISKSARRNKPGILAGIAVAGVIIEAITLYRKAPKIQKIISVKKEEYKEAKESGDFKEKALVLAEGAKELAPEVIPPALVIGGTIFCIIGSHKEHMRREAALMSMLAVSQTDLKLYKDKIKEMVGQRKSELIDGEVAQEHFDRHPVPKEFDDEFLTYADATDQRTVIFYDPWSDRYFRSSIEDVKEAFRNVISDLRYQDSVSLNDLYEYLGMDPTIAGKFFGFFSEHYGGTSYWHVDDIVRFAAGTVRGGDIPCLELKYEPLANKDTFGEPVFI